MGFVASRNFCAHWHMRDNFFVDFKLLGRILHAMLIEVMATSKQRIYRLKPACWPAFWTCSKLSSQAVKISNHSKSLEFS